jgi:hypothetical protein
MTTTTATDSYKEQLVHWSGALAAGRITEVSKALAGGNAEDVFRFLVETFGERKRLLCEELTFVALAFDDFDALVQKYLHQVPQLAHDPAKSDRERFLRWLQEGHPLTNRQRDFIAYQQAEYAVIAEARKRRAEHVAFQRARLQATRHLPRLGHDPALRIRLNPIRAWRHLALPGRAAGDALFFADSDWVRAAVLAPVERDLIKVLADGPCTLAECADKLAPASPEVFVPFCRNRAAEGLLAFE